MEVRRARAEDAEAISAIAAAVQALHTATYPDLFKPAGHEAGSHQKHYHHEKSLVPTRVAIVSRPYPFPYGFIVGTDAEDGCCVDCFVITDRPLMTGQLIECQPVGLMEQFEDGRDDHNILACPLGQAVEINTAIQHRLSEFVLYLFAHAPETTSTGCG